MQPRSHGASDIYPLVDLPEQPAATRAAEFLRKP